MEALETRTFSPKELAQVIGVSESSIKRWVDEGLIGVMRTAGGHRRILLREALRFIRTQGMRVLRPDLLGLPDLASLPPEAREGAFTGEVLFHLLERGEAEKARGILAGRYLNGTGPAELFDGPVAEALARIGTLWKEGEAGIYVEHMATGICIEAVNQIRLLMPPPGPEAPVALGAAPPGDPYILPGLMAAAVLADAGYAAVNLGPNTPYAAFLHAVDVHRPALVWVALTAPIDAEQAGALVEKLLVPLEQQNVQVMLGGQQALAHRDRWPASVHVLGSMAELAAHAAAKRSA